MNKFRAKLIHVMEVLVVIIVFFGIIAGLDSIGIFNFSKLFPWNSADSTENNNDVPYDDNRIYSALSAGKSNDNFSIKSELSREHITSLLNNISVADNYYQELNVTVYDSENKAYSTKATVKANDNNYDVSLFSSGGLLYKRIVQEDDVVQISVFDSVGNENKSTLSKGGFDIQSDTGIIMTHDRFFSENASHADDESFYSVEYSDYGSVLLFEFETTLDEYSQREYYWLSVDYGVVTRAECYEGEQLVYLLETLVLNSDV